MNVWKLASGVYRSTFGMAGKQLALNMPNRYKTVSAHTRTMWHMCSPKANSQRKFLETKPISESCQCGCSSLLHTQGERSLVDFLKTEIIEERKVRKMAALPKEVGGFVIQADGAELSFKKENKNETITISMNINHSVDTEDSGQGDDYVGDMKAKPSFEIDITRNNTTLNFNCSYVSFVEAGDEKGDVYQIDEVALFDGEWNDKNYSVAGDILDENLYDLFMSLLFEKGITNEFMEEVSEVATFYEHSKYIGLLEGIQKFSSAN